MESERRGPIVPDNCCRFCTSPMENFNTVFLLSSLWYFIGKLDPYLTEGEELGVIQHICFECVGTLTRAERWYEDLLDDPEEDKLFGTTNQPQGAPLLDQAEGGVPARTQELQRQPQFEKFPEVPGSWPQTSSSPQYSTKKLAESKQDKHVKQWSNPSRCMASNQKVTTGNDHKLSIGNISYSKSSTSGEGYTIPPSNLEIKTKSVDEGGKFHAMQPFRKKSISTRDPEYSSESRASEERETSQDSSQCNSTAWDRHPTTWPTSSTDSNLSNLQLAMTNLSIGLHRRTVIDSKQQSTAGRTSNRPEISRSSDLRSTDRFRFPVEKTDANKPVKYTSQPKHYQGVSDANFKTAVERYKRSPESPGFPERNPYMRQTERRSEMLTNISGPSPRQFANWYNYSSGRGVSYTPPLLRGRGGYFSRTTISTGYPRQRGPGSTGHQPGIFTHTNTRYQRHRGVPMSHHRGRVEDQPRKIAYGNTRYPRKRGVPRIYSGFTGEDHPWTFTHDHARYPRQRGMPRWLPDNARNDQPRAFTHCSPRYPRQRGVLRRPHDSTMDNQHQRKTASEPDVSRSRPLIYRSRRGRRSPLEK